MTSLPNQQSSRFFLMLFSARIMKSQYYFSCKYLEVFSSAVLLSNLQIGDIGTIPSLEVHNRYIKVK